MHRQIKILHIDDDEDDFFLVNSLIRKATEGNWSVYHAMNVDDAKRILNDKFDVFLVDYRLGKDTGLDLIKYIRKHLKHAPVILLTGMDYAELDWDALQAGANDYLVKGEFDGQLLVRSIRYALRQAELLHTVEIAAKRFKNIFELSSDPIAIIFRGGNVYQANKAFHQLFLIEENATESGDIKLQELIVDDAFKKRLSQIFIDGSSIEGFETKVVDLEGNEMPVILNIVPNDTSAESYHVMIKDLTQVRLREREALSLQKFSSMGRISQMLAHEVKNPLTTILLSAEQLKDELPNAVVEQSGDLVDVIKRNAIRINQLVSELLNSTRFTELNVVARNINDLLDEALVEAIDRIELQEVTIEKKYEVDICDVAVDGEKLKIALLNIIVNAIEAMEEQTSPQLALTTSSEDDRCKITISDNGSGISPEDIDHLFEPFFTKKAKGTGLGLANTQSIIFSHGGNLYVDSVPAKGTTFTIVLKMN